MWSKTLSEVHELDSLHINAAFFWLSNKKEYISIRQTPKRHNNFSNFNQPKKLYDKTKITPTIYYCKNICHYFMLLCIIQLVGESILNLFIPANKPYQNFNGLVLFLMVNVDFWQHIREKNSVCNIFTDLKFDLKNNLRVMLFFILIGKKIEQLPQISPNWTQRTLDL